MSPLPRSFSLVLAAGFGALLALAAAPAAPVPPGGVLVAQASSASGQAAPASGQAAPAYDPALYAGLDWRMVGPSRGGRVTAVAGHRAHPHTFYMGSTGGGVWKTEDYGHTWHNISDGRGFRTASIGAIRVAPSNPDVIYVGTGTDGIRSNLVTGRGVHRSTDAGETWTFLGLEETGQVGAVEIHPDDADLVYVAALGHPFGRNDERGVYRSRDGGESWENVLFVSDSVGAIDLELHPTDPSTVYATMWRGERKPWTIISGASPASGDGIWKSTDGGDTWEQKTAGLPDSLIGKADLAVTPDDPDRVYAVVEAPPEEEGLYRSDDAGETWRHVSDRRGLMERPFYYTNVDADPTDADVVYVGNEDFFRSADGGETWEEVDTPHVDNHDMWINPDDPDIYIQSNDGGVNVTLDGGKTWTTQHNQPTAELYQVDVDDRFPYWLYAGQQDNTTIAVPSLPPAEPAPAGASAWWKAIGGCETGPAVPKPGSDPLVVYANCKGRFGRFDMATGQEKGYWVGAEYMYGRNPAELTWRFQRTVPIEVSPHDPNVVYHGSQYVHRTTDDGRIWETISGDLTAFPSERQVVSGAPITRDITGEEHFSTLYVIEESPLREGLMWVGSNDGLVHVSPDGGGTWNGVTPEGLPPLARINAIQPSHHDPATAYVAAYRFQLDDWEPYVFRTTDGGRTWTRITDGSDGIPADHPVRVIREDPERPDLLYAGTEFGIFVSFDGGERWQSLQGDLPVTPVTDIEVVRGDLAISTMGRGFWILDDVGPLRQLGPEVAGSRVHLFAPRDAYRMRYRRPGAFGSRGPHEPEYPPPGAMVHYWLAEPAEEVRLEILDGSGELVRAFRAAEAAAEVEEEDDPRAMRAPLGRRSPTDRLVREPGMHRFIWDLRHEPAWAPEEDSRDRGPLAAPGTYTLRLTVDGEERSRRLPVKMDPRVREDGVTVADLREQVELNLALRDAIGEARRAAARLADAREGLSEGAPDRAAVDELHARLATADDGSSYPPPMLIEQLEYLYGMTTSADQRPGADAHARYGDLRAELDDLLPRVREVTAATAEDGR